MLPAICAKSLEWSIFDWMEGRLQFTVSEAKAKLSEYVRWAEDGEEIVLTRHGHEIVRARRSVIGLSLCDWRKGMGAFR